MNLDELVFKVDTTEVEKADRLMKELGVTIETVGAKIINSQNKQSQVEARTAKAAKDSAKARLDNAKATEVEEKAEERKQKATEKATAAIEKQTKAKVSQGEQTDKVAKLLKSESDILENLANGLSLGEAKRVAYARSLGAQVEQEKELISLQEQQRKFKSDPFDNSSSGLAKLNKELVQLQDAYRMNSAGVELTAKQSRELTRDKLRLIEAAKLEGNSILSVREQIRELNAQYISTANSVNQLASAEKTSLNSKKEIASATRLVTQEDEKMAAALSATNLQMNKASSDLLVRYETGLRRMGLTQDEYTKKLATYRSQLAQVQALEKQRAEGNLARALSPQMTDIAVSLYSGQAPLTVLLQQGGQIADLFRLSGVEAENFGKAMKSAFTSMIPVMATVAKGLASLVTSVLVDAGRGFISFAGNITGISAVLDTLRGKLAAGGEANQKYINTLDKIGNVSALAAGVGLTALLAGIASLGVGMVKAIKESDELAKTMFNTDAGFKATHREVLNLSTALADTTGKSAKDFAEILGQMAKQGGLAAEDVKIFGTVAVDQMKYLGMSAEEVVKQYSEMSKEPSKNLLKLAESTGEVSVATLKYVSDLVKAGEQEKAQQASIAELARVQKEQIEAMKSNLSGFAIAIKNIGENIAKFFNQAFDMVWKSADPTEKLRSNLEATMQEIEKVTNMSDSQFRGDRTKYLKDLQASLDAGQKELEVLVARNKQVKETKEQNADNAKILGITNELQEKANNLKEKELNKTRSLADFREAYIKKGLKDYAQEKQLDIDKIKNNEQILALLKQQADIEYQKLHKKDGAKAAKQAAKDLETEIDLLNKAAGLTTTYNNQLDALQRRRKAGLMTEAEYIDAVNKLIQLQPFYIAQEKEKADATDLSNKLLGKAAGLGKEYYETIQRIQEYHKKGFVGFVTEAEVKALEEAAYRQTEEAKKFIKAVEDSAKAYSKYNLEARKSLDDTEIENRKLDDRLELIGLTADEQEKLSREQKNRNKLLEVELKLARDIAKINADAKLDAINRVAAIKEVEEAAAEERKMINREVAIQAAEDYDKELRKIKEGITGSIVTALFEGGKKGSQKIREEIVNALKNPVTIVVNAMVNAAFGGLLGAASGLFGGSSSGGSGGTFTALSGAFNTSANTGRSLLNSDWFKGLGDGAFKEMLGQFGAGMMNTSSWSAASQSFQAGGAQMAGVIAGSIMNGFSGYGISRALSGGYSAGGWVNTAAGLASMIPGVGPIAGIVGGVVNRLFGRKLKDTGIEGQFGGDTGFEGYSYKYYKGGLFRSSKTEKTPLEEATRSGFANQFTAVRESISLMGEALGLGSDLLKDFTYKFKVSLKGLSEEEAAKKIQEEFDKMAEAMGSVVLTSTEYTREGESQLEALTRLATSLTGVNAMFDTLGLTLYEGTLKGADMASQLVDLFGTMEDMQSAVSSYYANYYSEEEKRATIERQLGKQFKENNLVMPKTREEFRKMVEGLDLTTESGRKMYAFLMTVSPAFAEITESTEDLAKAAADLKKQIADTRYDLETDLLRAQGKETEAVARERQKELEALRALDPELAKLKQQIYDTEDATKAANEAEKAKQEAEKARQELITKASNALTKAVNEEKKALQERITAAQASVNSLTAIFDLLENSIKSLYNQVDSTSKMTYANARRVITGAVATVRAGGSVEGITGLDTAVNDALAGLSADDYSTKIEYDRERLRLADELNTLKGTAKKELTNAEKQLDSLNEQVKRLDEILEYWQMQIDIANGTYTGILSVDEAVRELHKALFADKEAAVTPANPSGGGSGDKYVEQPGGASLGGSTGKTGRYVTGYTKDGRAVWSDGTTEAYTAGQNVFDENNQLIGSGNLTAEQWAKLQSGGDPFGGYWSNGKYNSNGSYRWDESRQMYVPAFAKGGNYRGGVALVGEEGPELINFGASGKVSTASSTSAMMEASFMRVQMLERALLAMQEDMKKVADNTKRTRDILTNVTPNGNAIQTEALSEE